MESKVIMYDAGGTEVGETYTRRARQLVKQQRAVWADDTHTAIRFAPDVANEWEVEPSPTPPSAPHSPLKDRTGALYAMAEKRVRDRRRLIWHTVALIPVFLILLIWGATGYNARRGGEMFLVFMGVGWGAWGMSYVSRLRNYFNLNGILPGNWESRRKMALDLEVDRLRRMGYSE